MENECDAQSAFIKSSRFARYHNSQFSIFNSQFVLQNKKLLSQISLGTGANTLLRYHANCVHSAHTSNNARSPDNGRSPRRSYLAEAVRLALLKSIHTVLACRNHTACGSLGGSVSLLLVFVIGLCWFTWYGHSIFAKQWIVKCDLRKIIYYFCYKFLL